VSLPRNIGVLPTEITTPTGRVVAQLAPSRLSPSRSPAGLPHGRHIVYLKTVDPDRRTIRFDLIQFYGGDEALREAAKDHPEASPEQVRQWVPNGYYIRNVNPRLRTLPVPSEAPITVITLAWGNGHNSSEEHIPVTLTKLATSMPTGLPFSITVRHGQVVKLAEVFVP
jgi:hypothetical protein